MITDSGGADKSNKETPADTATVAVALGKPTTADTAIKNPGHLNMEADRLLGSAGSSHVKSNGNGEKCLPSKSANNIKALKNISTGANSRSPPSPAKPEQEVDSMHSTADCHVKLNGVRTVPPPSKFESGNKSFKRISNGTTSYSPSSSLGEPKQEADKITGKIGPPGISDRHKLEKKELNETSGGILKNSLSSKLSVEARKKALPKPAKMDSQPVNAVTDPPKKMEANPPSKSAFSNMKSLLLSLNADPQVNVPPIKTMRTVKSMSFARKEAPANLCTQCRAEALEGAVCFIGNDGRVSACTSRNAVRLCKNLKCANNNPEYVASVAAANAGPKKYLVSRRHSLNLPRASSTMGSGKGGATAKPHAGSSDENGSSSQSRAGSVTTPIGEKDHEFDEQEELEHEVASSEDMNADDLASPSPQTADTCDAGRPIGVQKTRRASLSVLETQGLEVVTLKKQMMQERKNAEEWMLDYAIEEALQRLVPAKDSKVKALVEAFESINIPQNTLSEAGVHQ